MLRMIVRIRIIDDDGVDEYNDVGDDDDNEYLSNSYDDRNK